MLTREEIKVKFIFNATEHGKAIDMGDHKTANKIHKKLHILYNKAKTTEQLSIFSEMLNDSNENVRIWAATFTLKYLPDLAEKTLSELTELPSITGLDAKNTLQLWKEGKLNLL